MVGFRNLRQEIQDGHKICGTMFRTSRNPDIIYLAKNAGLDFFMLDCEHGSYDLQTVQDLALTANALGVALFARVPVGTKEYISRFLDLGVSGVMTPMVETPEQAREIVHWSKYAPLGGRGLSTHGPHTNFVFGAKHETVMAEANAQVMTIAQIETRLGVENADAIAAVDGVDALLIGPNDLSCALGFPGDLMNPIELEAIAAVAAACKRHNKLFAIHGGIEMQERFAKDLSFFMTATDHDLIARAFQNLRQQADRILP